MQMNMGERLDEAPEAVLLRVLEKAKMMLLEMRWCMDKCTVLLSRVEGSEDGKWCPLRCARWGATCGGKRGRILQDTQMEWTVNSLH